MQFNFLCPHKKLTKRDSHMIAQLHYTRYHIDYIRVSLHKQRENDEMTISGKKECRLPTRGALSAVRKPYPGILCTRVLSLRLSEMNPYTGAARRPMTAERADVINAISFRNFTAPPPRDVSVDTEFKTERQRRAYSRALYPSFLWAFEWTPSLSGPSPTAAADSATAPSVTAEIRDTWGNERVWWFQADSADVRWTLRSCDWRYTDAELEKVTSIYGFFETGEKQKNE